MFIYQREAVDKSDGHIGDGRPLTFFHDMKSLMCVGQTYQSNGIHLIQINTARFEERSPICKNFIILHEAGHIYAKSHWWEEENTEDNADRWAENQLMTENLRETCN